MCPSEKKVSLSLRVRGARAKRGGRGGAGQQRSRQWNGNGGGVLRFGAFFKGV